ncbi:MAG: hypothetical protein AMXMBFR7_11630 [Planctomycetota bacterium]
MFSGRHLLFLGALAAAGLVSVRDSQEQIERGYVLAEYEAQLREVRKEIAAERARLLALQTPQRVIDRAAELRLPVRPVSELELYTPREVRATHP